MSNVLVTGGAGSMGRLVSEKLINDGHQVNIFDLPQANYEGFDTSKTKIFKGNLNDSSIEESIMGVDTVIHLAAILPPTANINLELTEKVNVDGTRNLLSCIEKINPNIHIIFSSSVSIYGKNLDNSTIRLDNTANPDDHYAKTKYDSEVLIFPLIKYEISNLKSDKVLNINGNEVSICSLFSRIFFEELTFS